MIYKPFKNLQLSSLGFGAMRFSSSGSGHGAPIDYPRATEMLEYAYQHGINFYDTSYFYHDGDSERFLGKTMAGVPRDSWYLSSKLPGNLMKFADGKLEVSGKSFDRPLDVFDFQMERCGTDYFDFFMLHNVSESTYDIYTNEKLGLVDCLLEQKRKGRIRHLGFSTHGRHDTIAKFLDYLAAKGCKDQFEFSLVQVNYMDWTLQEANKKHALLTENDMAVFVMEPLRGGKLARLENEAASILQSSLRPSDSHASWSFRHLQSLDNIPVVLSGMSSMEQLKENIATFSKHDPITPEESALLDKLVASMADFIPCTSCGYCMEECPQKLDIPTLLTMSNEASYAMGWFLNAAIRALKDNEKPSACISCGLCNPLCPQNIDIPEALAKFSKIIES